MTGNKGLERHDQHIQVRTEYLQQYLTQPEVETFNNTCIILAKAVHNLNTGVGDAEANKNVIKECRKTIKAIRNTISKKERERINKYYLDYFDIRASSMKLLDNTGLKELMKEANLFLIGYFTRGGSNEAAKKAVKVYGSASYELCRRTKLAKRRL